MFQTKFFFHTTLLLFYSIGVIISQAYQKLSLKSIKKENGTIWAMLVAGSFSFNNYRHQADVCHAYQALSAHGVPDSNIIVMMVDDIAYSPENSKKGVIQNILNGPNVYLNVPKDYTGDQVNPENFISVLEGDDKLLKLGKKVIRSGPNDYIFIYFTDHGSPGLIFFPNATLSATRLNNVLKKMKSNNKFKKMLIYLEACESGSMFENLLQNNSNIFAMTASDSKSPSYACCYDDVLNTFVADCFSLNWLNNTDNLRFLKTETVENVFEIVKNETVLSRVSKFGDLSISKMPLSEFQGDKPFERCKHASKPVCDTFVSSRDVPLYTFEKKISKAKGEVKVKLSTEYDLLKKARSFIKASMLKVIKEIALEKDHFLQIWSQKLTLTQHECYEVLFDNFHKHCFNVLEVC